MTDPRPSRSVLARAVERLEDQDVDGALADIDDVLDQTRFDPRPALLRPLDDALQPAWSVAVDAVQAAIDRRPSAALRRALGRLQLAAGCPSAALDAFDQAMRDRAMAPEALLGKAEALLELGRPAQALALFDEGVLPMGDVRVLVGRARALSDLGRLADAKTAWRAVLDARPDDPVALRRAHASEPSATSALGADDEARAWRWALAVARDERAAEAVTILEELCARPHAAPEAWVALGRLRLEAGDLEAARQALDTAVRLPSSPRTRVTLGEALRRAHHPDAANVFEDAVSHEGADVVVLATAGAGLAFLDERTRGLELLDAAIARDPSYLPALAAKAETLTRDERRDEARQVWEEVVALDPGHRAATRALETRTSTRAGKTERSVARIHHDLGRSMLQRGRYREAVNAFRNATEIHPEWPDPWRQLGQTYLQLDERPAAIDAFRQALELAPDDAEAATRLGDLQRDQGALQAAEQAYGRAVALDDGQATAHIGLGETYRLAGRFDEALEAHNKALALAPDDPAALCGLAATLNGLRRFAEARSAWMRAREHDSGSTFVAKGLAQCHAGLRGTAPLAFEDVSREPQPRRATAWAERDPAYNRYEAMDHVDRGRSYHKERNFSAAIECFRKALEIDPTCDEAALRLGMAYEDDRQFRRAIAAYRTCLEIEPNHYQAATNIGEAYRKNEQYREALAAYDQALAMKRDYLYALSGRAECMRMLGRYEECLAWFDKALSAGANHAFAIQGKAAALNALQRFEDALEHWNHALEIEPQSQFALDGRDYCEAQLKRGDVDRITVTDEDTEEISGGTPTLDEQGRDLTALARQGKLPDVIGRTTEIRQVMKTLVRRLKANPLLLGEPGVGKTAVVEGLAQRLASGDAPARLADLRIVELSMGALIAGTKYRGTFEERLREIVKEATDTPGIVLFIDEIHTLVGAGRTEGGSLDAANILKPALARGEITVIGATTHAEYRRHFETDSALDRRFQPIHVDEPTPADCIALLTKVVPVYEKHHAVRVQPEALDACVHLSVRYIPDRRLPDKALDMLDEACAEASLAKDASVDAEIVARVVSDRTGVPVTKLTAADRDRMDRMEDVLGDRVVGQQDAIGTLANAVRLSQAGLRTPDRPRGVFLFQGASGVGKTELAKALSEFLFPEGGALIRLDMSEYADRFTTSRLLGAPPGYAGHGEEGQLTGPLRRKPYSVILLDEFEKAHPEVQSLFLSMLDEGRITDSDGRPISAREAFVILTTNAGTDTRGTGRMGFGSPGDDREATLAALEPYFRPELLDRIDEVVAFRNLDEDALSAIAQQRLEALAARAATHRVTLRWDDEVVARVAGSRRGSERGARQVIRAVDTHVGEALGRMLMQLGDDRARTLHAHVVDGEVRMDEVQTRQPSRDTDPGEPAGA